MQIRVKHFEKQPQPHFQIGSKPDLSFFLLNNINMG
jgi:hypothetical protein